MPAKELLGDQENQYRLLFEENPQPMLVLDPRDGCILEINRAARRLYGYSARELRGKTLEHVQSKEDAARFVATLEESAPVPALWHHHTKDGRPVDLEIAVHEIAYGGAKARLAVLVDVTGRREREDQLRQSQKMEAVGMLAGGVAHDFNNLLTIITGYSQLILTSLAPDDPNRHSAEQIMKAGERAAALTRQLLAFSRRQVLQPRVLDLNKLVSGLGTMLRRLIGEDIDLRLVTQPDVGSVSADPGQIEQVLMNLAVNSRDAMPKGGVLTIETTNVYLGGPYLATHPSVKAGAYVMLAVSDNGTGMDANTRTHLFEPFFTTKGAGHGTGLGLSTVFGIIKQSGGSVEVYSEPGHGTCVKVYLPRIDQPATAEAQNDPKLVARGSETILLAEDDDMVRTLVRETLERHGYTVLESSDPIEARHTAERHRGPIDLLITDVVMPKVNGRELANQLAAKRPGMKVLFMSGYTDNAVVASGVLQREVAFLRKPFTPAALTEKVREVLEGNGKTRQAGE